MHSRRFACFLVGLWLAGGLMMALVATQNFRSVDRIIAHPNPVAAVHMKTLGAVTSRLLLRYEASEVNRWMFETWEVTQIFLGAFVFFFLLFGTSEGKISLALILLALVAVVVQRFLLTPEIVSLGRILDFVPPDMPTADRTKFWVLHSGYTGLEIGKWGVEVFLVMKMIGGRRGRSGDARNEVDLVDKTNNRHIDR